MVVGVVDFGNLSIYAWPLIKYIPPPIKAGEGDEEKREDRGQERGGLKGGVAERDGLERHYNFKETLRDHPSSLGSTRHIDAQTRDQS